MAIPGVLFCVVVGGGHATLPGMPLAPPYLVAHLAYLPDTRTLSTCTYQLGAAPPTAQHRLCRNYLFPIPGHSSVVCRPVPWDLRDGREDCRLRYVPTGTFSQHILQCHPRTTWYLFLTILCAPIMGSMILFNLCDGMVPVMLPSHTC